MNRPGEPPPDGAPARRIVLYGRRKGRRLRPGQRQLLDRALPEFEVRLTPGQAALEPARLFDFVPSDIWLEVGFGAGEHLITQAIDNPGIGFIGCEPFLDGAVKVLAGIRDHDLANIRIFRDDARLLLARLPGDCLGRAFVLFPDPWPKTRHHKRRFISPPVLDQFARVLRDGAELRVATDDPGYLVWILRHLMGSADFAWTARRPRDWRQRPPDWPSTRYEEKAVMAGRRCTYLRFERGPRAARGA